MAIRLEKGQRINLEKDNGAKLQSICVGVNWGAIKKKNWLGFTTTEAVDLDASCAQFDAQGNIIDKVWFRHLASNDGAIKHSGDDLTGDMDGDDGLDNEVITVDLHKVNPRTDKIAFVLNSFRGQDFKLIPFASIRIYEGTPTKVREVFATYDIANDTYLYHNKHQLHKFRSIMGRIRLPLPHRVEVRTHHQSSWYHLFPSAQNHVHR